MASALDYSKIADCYDSLVHFEADIPFFLEACRQASGPVLELMSGTGRLSVPLLAAGVDLTCLDSSPEMLAVLRRKLIQEELAAMVIEQDVTQLDLSAQYDLVFIPFQSFEELSDPDSQRAALDSIRGLLSPGGRFICTLHNPTISLQEMTKGPRIVARSDFEGDELILKMDVVYDGESGVVEGTQTLLRQNASHKEVWRRILSLRYVLIEEKTFRRLAKDAEFVVEHLYGDYDRSPFESSSSPLMIWVLRQASAAATSNAS